MLIEYIKGVPIAIIDDLFTEEEHAAIFEEINFIRKEDLLFAPEDTGSAKHPDGTIKKQNSGAWFVDLYKQTILSPTCRISPKILDEKLVNKLVAEDIMFNFLRNIHQVNSLLSYYDESDNYHTHVDASTFTVIHWLYKEPKKFDGGVFTFEGEGEIECVNGRVIYMPGFVNHGVTPVKLKTEDTDGWGRYTISHFLQASAF